MKLFIDLFAGLCGASQAFIDHDSKDWMVIAVENNPLCFEEVMKKEFCNWKLKWIKADISDKFTFMKIKRLIQAMQARFGTFDQIIVWASPPCTEFSDAQSNRPSNPSMVLLEDTIKLIEKIAPDHWYIENVKGAIRDFNPHLGMWHQKMGPFFVWGNFPRICVPRMILIKQDAWSTNPLRANIRAKIPFEVSLAIKHALECQLKITSWIS